MILNGIVTIIKMNILFYVICIVADIVVFKVTNFSRMREKLFIPIMIVIDYLHSVFIMSSAIYQDEIKIGFSFYNFFIMLVPTILILAIIIVIRIIRTKKEI